MNALPFVELDAATQLYFPREPARARAQHRFIYRDANGDEEMLLARLCVFKRAEGDGRGIHFVVLKPENAEDARLFINHSQRGWSRTPVAGRGAQQPTWDWELFAQKFNAPHDSPALARCTLLGDDQQFFVRCHNGKEGQISGPLTRANSADLFRGTHFRWSQQCDSKPTSMQWLRTPVLLVREQLERAWNQPQHEIHYAAQWNQKDETARAAIAFECDNGSWSQLRQVALNVTRLLLFHRYKPGTVHNLDIFNCSHRTPSPPLGEVSEFEAVLLIYRQALAQVFLPRYFNRTGIETDLPSCLELYIRNHAWSRIKVGVPTMHELIEANLQLQTWTRQNFSPEQADVLMSSLAQYSQPEAQQFRDSLGES